MPLAPRDNIVYSGTPQDKLVAARHSCKGCISISTNVSSQSIGFLQLIPAHLLSNQRMLFTSHRNYNRHEGVS
jgi:hypothetical protein